MRAFPPEISRKGWLGPPKRPLTGCGREVKTRVMGCTVSSQGIWKLPGQIRNQGPESRGDMGELWGLWMSSELLGKPGQGPRVINSSKWTLQIAQGVTHSESQKCDFKSISKIRLGVAEGRLKFQPIQTLWNIKPWMFGGNKSRKHLSQLLTSASGARTGSPGNEELSQILQSQSEDRSRSACEYPFAAVRTDVTFCTVQEHETSQRAFPINHFISSL